MLWYKHWLETRWRFFIGLILLTVLSAIVVFTEPLTSAALQNFQDPGGKLGEILREQMEISKTYEGYVWMQWFGKNLLFGWILFAILIGVGGVVTESSRGSALFTLSLPVTRRRMLAVRAATGTLELAILALAPSLLIPLLSLLIGEAYSALAAIVYVALMVVGGIVFFSFSILLSTIFSDKLKPVVVGLVAVFILETLSLLIREFAPYSITRIMSGASYFRTGELPWMGLAVSLAVAAAMFYLSLRIVERRDF
jgi:ABC-type transport system involved in multi-copper enzyme maturation permease subunit